MCLSDKVDTMCNWNPASTELVASHFVESGVSVWIFIITSTLRLLGRFTCLAQTTIASRLLFALGRHFIPRECEKNWKFSSF